MGRTVVITGVTSGLGWAMACWFSKQGHKVIGCGRSKDKIDQLNSLYKESGCMFSVVDVSEKSSVKKWAEETLQLYGSPHLVLNNAGLVNKPATLWEVSLEDFDKVIDVNIKGTNNVIHFFLPSMIQAKQGIIVNFSSGWGRSTAPEVAPYCCSKWGIEGLSLALAKELPSPLACASLNPGMINTDMLQTCFGKSANYSPSPDQWIEDAGPMLLKLDRSCNGRQLSV